MAFTEAQRARLFRQIREYLPPVDDRSLQAGGDLATFLEEIVSAVGFSEEGEPLQMSGVAVVENGDSDVDVELPGMDGKPVVAVLGEVDGTATNHVMRVGWDGSDVLTITLSAATDGARSVFWMLDGR